MDAHETKDAVTVVGGGIAQRANDTLMIRRCARCDKLLAPITAGCSSCGSDDLVRVPSSGAGSIVSWRVVDRAPSDRRGELVPLTIAIVELDEGPWVYTSIEGDIPPIHGEMVRVHFQPHPREARFPVFTVCADPRETEHRCSSSR
ncbi:OB-fold domain-containing protein [Nocardia beijingensis]|uniref:Zn-ribbon domain-containing OB-fold protein n=1 Tax=Nocardia beijingensis TaxID=95162 RepID=UPI0018958BB6|nr:OB-fold domain-containing protein [Nocardia beijingensis]MBF6469309.1 OB-fold domain-containing protein [Nocardia beijingensis]